MTMVRAVVLDELRETIDTMKAQDDRWGLAVKRVQLLNGISHYPERKHFIKAGEATTYSDIQNCSSQEMQADSMGIDTKSVIAMKENVFDIMLNIGINWYPTQEDFERCDMGHLYEEITKRFGHTEFRLKMGLKHMEEYLKISLRNRVM